MPIPLQQFLLVLLLMFLGFCLGMFIASFLVVKAEGFTGPAIAIWYGLGGLIAGLISSIILIRTMLQRNLRIALIIAGIISMLVAGWIIYRIKYLKDQHIAATINFQHNKINNATETFLHAGFIEDDTLLPAGIGMAKPHLENNKIIYFYSMPPLDESLEPKKAFDSLIIKKGKYQYEISYAPPWFFPEVMKLDYDMLFLRSLSISKNWIEVIVNKQTGQTYWISIEDADFINWSNFLLDAYSIELVNPEANPLRIKPFDHASIVATTPEHFSLHPIAIHGDWMMVSTLGLADRIVPTGWIRWHKDERLLIRYSLLS